MAKTSELGKGEDILRLWKDFQRDGKNMGEQFNRLVFLSTNVLEGVFHVNSDSWTSLIRKGFHEKSITGISHTSETKDRKKIIRMLNQTKACFELIPVDPEKFDSTAIKQMHSMLLERDDVHDVYTEDGDTYCELIPRGQYRRVACYTTHPTADIETRYCKSKSIEEEMTWYLDEARDLLRQDTFPNPFLTVLSPTPSLPLPGSNSRFSGSTHLPTETAGFRG